MVFPEVFIPGTPVWVYNQTIWERDDAWYAMLVDQAITVPGPVTDGLGAAAKDAGVYLVMGVDGNRTAPLSTAPSSTSELTTACSASIASSCPPAQSARCGVWAMGPH
ncbi:MAG: nitrilase-related carbon-nitrogen hydrolase [Propionibacteriaceae bacterium]